MTVEDLRNALKSEKVTFGSKEVLRKLRTGEVKQVFLSSTCADVTRATIKRYASLKKVQVVELSIPSSEVALLCKKNFPVGVLSC